MPPQKFNQQFATIYDLAVRLSEAGDADALLVMLDGPTDWDALKERAGGEKIVVAADEEETFKRELPKVGRNDPCPCGNGRKFKHCHGRKGAPELSA